MKDLTCLEFFAKLFLEVLCLPLRANKNQLIDLGQVYKSI